jgi:signal transduction histidine kinase
MKALDFDTGLEDAARPACARGQRPEALAAAGLPEQVLAHLAHELRTPLGQISALASLLAERAADRLSPEERHWLDLQRDLGARLIERMDALLALAQADATPLLREWVDLSALADSVIDELDPVPRRAPVAWQVERGLHAHCNPALARVLLLNLLGNAAKYTRDSDAPVVGCYRSRRGGFAVEDNGVGFAPQQAGRLFQAFVRLHGDEFGGTGVGLSLVRRIVEGHGGQVTASGRLGAGALFEFDFGPLRR